MDVRVSDRAPAARRMPMPTEYNLWLPGTRADGVIVLSGRNPPLPDIRINNRFDLERKLQRERSKRNAILG
jgi:hypothetical protein